MIYRTQNLLKYTNYLNEILYNVFLISKGYDMNKFILKLFLLFLLTFKLFASDVEILNNNINNNLDSLTFQLKYSCPDKKKNDGEITNLLKLYYQHFDNIQAIEIYHLKIQYINLYKKIQKWLF